MKGYAILGRVFRFLVYLFLLLPLIVIICTSVSDTRFIIFPPQGFTLRWFQEALSRTEFIRSVWISFQIALLGMILSTTIGTIVSLYFWKAEGRIKNLVELTFLTPVVIPTVVSAVAFMQFYSMLHVFPNNYIPMVLSYSIVEIAYVIRTVTACLSNMESDFEEAALVLGASPRRTLFKVTLPCAKRGIIGGAIFAFIFSFDEAVIVMFMSDPKTMTYPLRLYSYIAESLDPMVSAFSTMFIILSFIIVVVVEKTIGLNKMNG